MDPVIEREARRLVGRYLDVVERFDLCPWAQPARERGEVRIDVVDVFEVAAAVDDFVADDGAAIALIVLPRFGGDSAALRRVRDEILASPRGAVVALADFHPDAPLDAGDAARLVPWLRRAPDPMLQAVRHTTLAGLRRSSDAMSPRDQAALLAGLPVTRPRDPIALVADANLATVQARGDAVAAAFDELARDRAETYARLRKAG